MRAAFTEPLAEDFQIHLDLQRVSFAALKAYIESSQRCYGSPPVSFLDREDECMRGYHDLGGLPAGPIERCEHDKALWEKRVHALLTLLARPDREVMNVDELRRGIEALGAAEYERLSYYERWISSITNILLQKGVLTADELGRKLAEVERREAHRP